MQWLKASEYLKFGRFRAFSWVSFDLIQPANSTPLFQWNYFLPHLDFLFCWSWTVCINHVHFLKKWTWLIQTDLSPSPSEGKRDKPSIYQHEKAAQILRSPRNMMPARSAHILSISKGAYNFSAVVYYLKNPEGYSTKFYTERLSPELHTLTIWYTRQKR